MDTLKLRMKLDRHMPLVLMTLNALCFIAVRLSVALGGASAVEAFALPADGGELLSRPWTLLLYMFTQWDFLHMAVNILWLWCWCRICESTAACATMQSGRHIATAYLVGGFAGALSYLAASALGVDSGICLVGCSAAVIGLIAAGAVNAIHSKVNLLIFGCVRLILVAAVAIGLCLLGDLGGNLGTLLAHSGGLVGGLAYGLWLKFSNSHPRKAWHPREVGNSGNDDADLDALLAKVGRSGYGSLTPGERDRLFDISRRI